mgnify:CR=1 FL=1
MKLDSAKVTPKVTGNWFKVHSPDTKFNTDGVFSVDVILDPNNPEHEQFMEQVDNLAQEFADVQISEDKKKKNWKVASKFKEVLDDEGDETGLMSCKFKQNAKMTAKKTGKVYEIKRIPVVDAKKKTLDTAIQIGNGSTVRIKFETRTYMSAKDKEFGVTLDLKMVQVIKLNALGSNDADGFDEEDGFISDDESFESTVPANDNTSEDF